MLHFDNIVDSSPCPKMLDNSGVVISKDTKKFGTGSGHFNGSSKISLSLSPAFEFGTGDFTIDCWFYATKGTTEVCFYSSTSNGGLMFGLMNNQTQISIGRQNQAWDSPVNFTWENNVWTHVAVVRHNNIVTYYKNGVSIGSVENTISYGANSGYVTIGGDNSRYFNGYIDELRVSAKAEWTGSFTPPTQPYSIYNPDGGIDINNILMLHFGEGEGTIGTRAVPEKPPTSTNTLTYLSPGSTLSILENNVPTEFLVLQHGYPNSEHENTILLRKNIYNQMAFGNNGVYNGSIIDNWCQNDYPLLFDESIRNQMVAVPINSNGTNINRKSFILSSTELGYDATVTEGVPIPYFDSNFKRIAKYNNSADYWSTRTQYDSTRIEIVPPNGSDAQVDDADNLNGIRPAFCLPYNTQINMQLDIKDSSPYKNPLINSNMDVYTANKKFGVGSGNFNASNKYLSIQRTDMSLFNLHYDFTIDCWIYVTEWKSAGFQPIFVSRVNGGIWIGLYNNGYFGIHGYNGGTYLGTTTLPPLNEWIHVAFCRQGGVGYIFYNGELQTTSTLTQAFVGGPIFIGHDGGSEFFNGIIDELRISKGIARWTENFTPPDRAYYMEQNYYPINANTDLLLHLNDNVNDSSDNKYTITNTGISFSSYTEGKFNKGSAYGFSASNMITADIGNNINFDSLDKDFTIDFWAKLTSVGGPQVFLDRRNNVNGNGWIFDIESNGIMYFYLGINNSWHTTIGGAGLSSWYTPIVNEWTHFAVVKYKNNITIYINGIQYATGAVNGVGATIENYDLFIGHGITALNNQYYIIGNLEELEILNYARWTSNFVPPIRQYGYSNISIKKDNELISPKNIVIKKDDKLDTLKFIQTK